MDLEIDDNPTCYGCGFYSHQYTYKHITINQHQKHLPRTNRKEDVMYGIRKQSWQRHKVERTPSAALNQYNRVCDSESGLFLLINTYTYSIIYLKYMKFCHGKNFTHYMFMILIDTRTIIEKNLLTHHIFFFKWVG